MKICIVSDSHDRAEPLAAAVSAAKAQGAQAVIHCGDVIGAQTLRSSIKLGLPLHVVHGNNLGDPTAMQNLVMKSAGLLNYHGLEASITLAGRRVYAIHYPHLGRGMACTGEYDLVCCGHSHSAAITEQRNIKGGHTLLVNPGTVAGIEAPGVIAPCTWILGDLDRMSFEIRTLEN